MSKSVCRAGLAAFVLPLVIGCSSAQMKAEPFPPAPDEMKRGPGLFTGSSGELDVVALTRGEPQGGGAEDVSDFEAWRDARRGAGGEDDDISAWLGEAATASEDEPGPAPSDVSLQGLQDDPDYQEYLEYKRWKEFRDFQQWKRQQQQ